MEYYSCEACGSTLDVCDKDNFAGIETTTLRCPNWRRPGKHTIVSVERCPNVLQPCNNNAVKEELSWCKEVSIV